MVSPFCMRRKCLARSCGRLPCSKLGERRRIAGRFPVSCHSLRLSPFFCTRVFLLLLHFSFETAALLFALGLVVFSQDNGRQGPVEEGKKENISIGPTLALLWMEEARGVRTTLYSPFSRWTKIERHFRAGERFSGWPLRWQGSSFFLVYNRNATSFFNGISPLGATDRPAAARLTTGRPALT